MKAQSATEYALNYGWALTIIIIIAVLLYALGVFSPGAVSGRTVAGFQELGTPVDWELTSANSEMRLKLANDKAASTVAIYKITVMLNGQGTSYSYVPEALRIAPGKAAEVKFQLQPQPQPALGKGSSYSARVAIVYNSGGYNHTDVGTITGIVG